MTSGAELSRAVRTGADISYSDFDALSPIDLDAAISELLEDSIGRRWLRSLPRLDVTLADRLLTFDLDFRQQRRDRTLGRVVASASDAALHIHAGVVAGGPASGELWARYRERPEDLSALAEDILRHGDRPAAEATLYLLVLDEMDPYRLGEDSRRVIALAGLSSGEAVVRGLAAEFLADHDPRSVLEAFDRLVHDDDERVRGIAWSVGLQHERRGTYERAVSLVGDEAVPTAVRRSALVSIGMQMPTRDLIDILSYLVVHPDPVLARDAASLLYGQHRNPMTAEAARFSPHPDVREIAERLLDPFVGSPAAGGSRPGDPTAVTDIYAGMIRQLEEREAAMRDQENDGEDRQ